MRAMILGLALLGGCTTVPRGAPVAIEGDSIRYETGPCFGTCPVYAVTVTPDGRGTFEGKRFTAVSGRRDFAVTPDQYRAFAALLARWRPETGAVRYSHGEANCANAPTDMPSAEVTWTRAIGDSQSLYFYYGCDRDNPELAQALSSVPRALPIAAFIGGD